MSEYSNVFKKKKKSIAIRKGNKSLVSIAGTDSNKATTEASNNSSVFAANTMASTMDDEKYNLGSLAIPIGHHSRASTTKNLRSKKTRRISSLAGVADGNSVVSVCRPDVMINCFMSSLREGVPHGLSLLYFVDVPGNIYFLIYLLLLRDFSWSQYIFDYNWIYVGIVAGAASVFWSVGLLLGAVRFHFDYMAWISSAIVLWTISEFIWMSAEFYSVDVSNDPNNHIATMGRIIAQYILICALLMMTIFYSLLIPFGVFNTNTYLYSPASKSTIERLDETNPFTPRFWSKFAGNRDFAQYSGIHILLWTLKDLSWSFGLLYPYIIFFALSCLFLIDLSLRECSQTLQFANIINTLVIKLWITANGFWVLGDLKRSSKNIDFDTMISELQKYARGMKGSDDQETIYSRKIAGWIYLITIAILVIFYLNWIMKTRQSTKEVENGNSSIIQPYWEYKKQFSTNTITSSNVVGGTLDELALAEQASLVTSTGFSSGGGGENKLRNTNENEERSSTAQNVNVLDAENNIRNPPATEKKDNVMSNPFETKKKKKASLRNVVKDSTIDTNAEVSKTPVIVEASSKDETKSTEIPAVADSETEKTADNPPTIKLFFPGMTRQDSDKHFVADIIQTSTSTDEKNKHDITVSTRRIEGTDTKPSTRRIGKPVETLATMKEEESDVKSSNINAISEEQEKKESVVDSETADVISNLPEETISESGAKKKKKKTLQMNQSASILQSAQTMSTAHFKKVKRNRSTDF